MIMSTITGTATLARGGALPGRGNGILAFARRAWIAYMTWRIERVAIEQLGAMSDRQLKDIGLTRSEIEAAARGTILSRR
jgi:uncharacterized protein YjiS (DUF1127 family)